MNRQFPLIAARAVAALLLLASLPVFARAEPVEMLRSVSDEMIERLRAEQQEIKDNPQRLFELVEDVLVPHVDTEVMSRMVLGVSWRRATAEQRARFSEEFKTLLVRFYVSALLEDPNQLERLLADSEGLITFQPGGEAKDERIRVRAQVNPPDGPTVPVSFSLYQKDGQWLVYDVNVDGISMVINYRSSFASQVSRDGLPALIDNLAKRNKELLRKTAAAPQ